jgi:hypothetical protein
MSSPKLRFDFRDLAAALHDSCGDSKPFGFDLFERPAIGLKRRLLADQRLPSQDYDLDVLRIKFHAAAGPLC